MSLLLVSPDEVKGILSYERQKRARILDGTGGVGVGVGE